MMRKTYKVGEFAKNLGVTIGFLKHHEADGILAPHISPSGYRYYEYPQAMQALQCLRMQSIGFSGKEVAEMLNHSSTAQITEKVRQKQKELEEDIIYYQELLKYLEKNVSDITDADDQGLIEEDWSIGTPAPFYYLENSENFEFTTNPDNETYDIICNWNRYMPMTGLLYYLSMDLTQNPHFDIHHNGAGLYIDKKTGDRLKVHTNAQVQTIAPCKSLIYTYRGNREHKIGTDAIQRRVDKPLQICRDHNFNPTGEVYILNYFASTANKVNYVHETILLPLR